LPIEQGVARKFDKVMVIDSMTGVPNQGMIIEGSKRVIVSGDKAPI
jgi:septum formation inhibitor-activating ATPase MinD